MRRLAASCVVCAWTMLVHGEVYWNGDIVTDIGLGFGGADISRVDADPESASYGLNVCIEASNPGPFHAAENLVIPSDRAALTLFGVTVYGWARHNDPISAAYLRIWDRSPNSLDRVALFGDFETNRLIQSLPYQPNGRDVYRVSYEPNLQDTDKRILAIQINTGALELAANHEYWLEWSLECPSQHQVFGAPVATYPNGRGDALYVRRNGVNPLTDYSHATLNINEGALANSDFAFSAQYHVVPETTGIVTLVSGLTTFGWRKRRPKRQY